MRCSSASCRCVDAPRIDECWSSADAIGATSGNRVGTPSRVPDLRDLGPAGGPERRQGARPGPARSGRRHRGQRRGVHRGAARCGRREEGDAPSLVAVEGPSSTPSSTSSTTSTQTSSSTSRRGPRRRPRCARRRPRSLSARSWSRRPCRRRRLEKRRRGGRPALPPRRRDGLSLPDTESSAFPSRSWSAVWTAKPQSDYRGARLSSPHVWCGRSVTRPVVRWGANHPSVPTGSPRRGRYSLRTSSETRPRRPLVPVLA